MIDRKSWEEFREAGLLWWVNRALHIFGWAIVFNFNGDRLLEVYPARVKFRGFSQELESDGYKKLSEYLASNAEELKEEAQS